MTTFRRWPATAAILALVAVVGACEPSAPPGFTGSAPPVQGSSGAPAPSVAGPDASGLVAGQPVVTVDGTNVTIQGLGSGPSPEFALPAGSAVMTVTACSSNQVIPFVTLYDASDTKLAIIVDPEYALENLAGGNYYVDVSSNPTCVWSVKIDPA